MASRKGKIEYRDIGSGEWHLVEPDGTRSRLVGEVFQDKEITDRLLAASVVESFVTLEVTPLDSGHVTGGTSNCILRVLNVD